MGQTFELDFTGPQPFEIPALLIATLARPSPDEAEARMRLADSLCVWLMEKRCAIDPEWAFKPQLIKPAYFTLSEARIKADMRTLQRRLTDRMFAGHVAAAFLMEAERGETPKLPLGVRWLSLNEMCKAVAKDRGIEAPENFESRVWRPSLPVIHISAAWTVTAQETGRRPDPAELYTDPVLLRTVIVRAIEYIPLLEKSRLKISRDSLIDFVGTAVGSNIP